MAARTLFEAQNEHRILREGWKVCSTTAGECATPDQLNHLARDWVPAEAPCTVASALQAAGRWHLDGPEVRFDASDWWFTLQFDAPGANAGDAVLEFAGLATLCEVWLNGELLQSCANMFVSHSVPASTLRPGHNTLHLAFRSLDAALKERRPRPRWRVPMIENQQLRWFRTTTLGRTPGWSLPAAPVGPWRAVSLSHGPATFDQVRLQASLTGSTGTLRFRARASLLDAARLPILRVLHGGKIIGSALVERSADELSAQLVLTDIEVWWPHTHGSPALYEVLLSVTEPAGAEREISLGKVGFRTVKAHSTDGKALMLSVNGEAIFCRGACWTPTDPISLGTHRGHLRKELERIAATGFNMLRVSGTCIYEDEEFFILCDQLGIMIWQDFMFASMDFPADDECFLQSVQLEVEQQLRMWDSHPSVVVICGNSEVSQQSAMWGRPREEWYPELFATTLRELAGQYCPAAIYWPSSASGGEFPHQANAGTCSYYGVGAYLRSPDDARHSGVTFATECLAFSNIPEDATLARMPGGLSVRAHSAAWKRRSPRDLGAGWDFDDVRDHYVQAMLGVDPVGLRYSDHARFLALGRQAVAEIMIAAFTQWRRPGSACSGALVWFLRDMWPGAGWGIIDSQGEPKSPWYALRRTLQPHWLGVTDVGLNGIVVHLVNETNTRCGGQLRLTMYRDGRQIIGSAQKDVEVAARSGLSLNATELFEHFHDFGHAYRFGPRSCDLVVARFQTHDDEVERVVFFLPRPELHVQQRTDCLLQAHAEPISGSDNYKVTLSCNGFARGVNVVATGYAVSDQYFDLEAGGSCVVTLQPHESSVRPTSGFITAINAAAPAPIQFAV